MALRDDVRGGRPMTIELWYPAGERHRRADLAVLGGAIAARFASERRDQLSRLVLVDSFGLSWNRT